MLTKWRCTFITAIKISGNSSFAWFQTSRQTYWRQTLYVWKYFKGWCYKTFDDTTTILIKTLPITTSITTLIILTL